MTDATPGAGGIPGGDEPTAGDAPTAVGAAPGAQGTADRRDKQRPQRWRWRARRSGPPTDHDVEIVRAHAGLAAVIVGDLLIIVASVIGVTEIGGSKGSDAIVSILTSAFTAIGTLSAAYFGIKAVANTAQTAVVRPVAGRRPGGGQLANEDQPEP